MYLSDEKSITDENNEASFKAHSHGAVRSITLFYFFNKTIEMIYKSNDYDRSCAQLNISCEWGLSGSCD